MPHYRHDKSAPVGVAGSVASREVLPTQTTVEYGGVELWDVVSPQEAVAGTTEGGIITYQIPASVAQTPLDECYVRLEGNIAITAGGVDPIPPIGGADMEEPFSEAPTLTLTAGGGHAVDFVWGANTITAVSQPLPDGLDRLVTLTFPPVTVLCALAAPDFVGIISDVALAPKIISGFPVTFFSEGAGGAETVAMLTVDPNGTFSIFGDTNLSAHDYTLGFTISYVASMKEIRNLTVPPFFPIAAFNSARIALNGTEVVQSQGVAAPYGALAGVIKNEPWSTRETGDLTQGYILDGWNSAVAASDRRNFYLKRPETGINVTSGATVGFVQILRLTDLGLRTNGTWLPPDTTIRITLRRAQNASLVQRIWLGDGTAMNDVSAVNPPVFSITAADLYVSRRVLAPHALEAYQHTWQVEPKYLPMEQTQTFTQFFGAADTDVNIVGALAGKTPTAVYAFLTTAAALNGTDATGANPIFRLGYLNDATLSNVSLSIGGARMYPVRAMHNTANTELGPSVSQLYEMYRMTCNSHPFLKPGDFYNIKPICFQIGQRADPAVDPAEDVSVQFRATLSAQPGVAWAMVLVSFTPRTVEFDVSGRVTVV